MTGNSTPGEKVRAIFLAAIMVVSVFGATMAFAGSSAGEISEASPGSPTDVTVGNQAAQDIDEINITNASSGEVVQLDLAPLEDEGVNISEANASRENVTGGVSEPTVNEGVVEVSVQSTDEGDVSFNLTLEDLNTSEANFASGLTYEVTHGDSDESVEAQEVYGTAETEAFDLVGFEVTDLDAPRVTQNDTEMTVTATIDSNFNDEQNQTIDYRATAGDDEDGDVDQLVASEDVTLEPGTQQEVEFTVNTANESNGGDLPDDGALPREYTHGVFSDNDGEDARLTVGVEEEGSIAVTVRGDFNPDVGDVTDVALFSEDAWDSDPDDRGEPFEVRSTDGDDEVEFRDLAIGPNTNDSVEYTALAAYEDENFESSYETDALNAEDKTSTGLDIFIDRNVTADQITIDSYDPSDTVEVGETIDITTLIESYEVDDSDLDSLDPMPDADVNVTDIEQTAGDDTVSLTGINESDENSTDDNGLAAFNDIGVDTTADEVEENLVYDITFEATPSDDDETVNVTAPVTFQAEPPSGDGFIGGDVDQISEDIELGAQSENAESASGVNVHAVRLDRIGSNTIAGEGTNLTVPADSTEYVRVAALDDDGNVDEYLDVQTDYLFTSSEASLSQNLSIEGTGFNAEDTDGTDSPYAIHVLESGDYRVEISENGSFADATSDEFTADNDLNYSAIDTRYENVSAEPTDKTGDDGEFSLQNLYTNGESGQEYVVIAGDGNGALGFANGQGYDQVSVNQSADLASDQYNLDLNVQQVDVQADAVNITNVGTIPSADDADADFELEDEFDDRDVRQEVPRDGSTVDVIDLRTYLEEDDTTLGANVTVSSNVTDGSFDGEFLNASVGGDVLEHTGDTITVDTSDGDAFVFLETDSAGLGDDANVTIDAEMDDAPGADSTDKEFFGVLDQDYKNASITGVVADEDDNPVDGRIFVSEMTDPQNNIEITFEPDSVDDLENFTATVTDDDGNEIETVNLTAEEMQEFEFQGFESDLDLADGEEPYQLLADRAADRTTLSPVPALDDEPLVSYALTGVSQTGETGTSKAETVEVDRTSTASIVIEGVETADFQVSDLSPEEYTAESDETFTVSATVENVGDLSGEKDVELRLDGDTVATESVELDAGDSTPVEFEVDASDIDAGEYTHSVYTEDSEASGTLTVEEAPTQGNWYDAYVDDDGVVDDAGLNDAVSDYLDDELSDEELNYLVESYLGETPMNEVLEA